MRRCACGGGRRRGRLQRAGEGGECGVNAGAAATDEVCGRYCGAAALERRAALSVPASVQEDASAAPHRCRDEIDGRLEVILRTESWGERG